MFKRLTIHMTAPICTCEEQKLSWGISYSDEKNPSSPGMQITCQTCNTKLVVPNSKFIARFEFDSPYPGKLKQEPAPESEMKN